MEKSVFQTLCELDLTSKHREKNKLSYLPWASAWAAVKAIYPDATYDVVKSPDNNIYWSDERTCWVETSITIGGITQNEVLAVMDYKNKSIPYLDVTSVDIQKSIKRCMTKNLALFGLDLNLWIGEELSDEAKEVKAAKDKADKAAEKELKAAIKEIATAGTQLVSTGYSAEKLNELVAKYNEGNGNINSINSIEVCNDILKEMKSILDKKVKKNEG